MKLLYIADIRLPTEKAHGIAIMQMCAAFAAQGMDVELVIPSRRNFISENPFSYYQLEPSFRITKLQGHDTVLWGRFGFLLHAALFGHRVALYARKQNPDMLYGRDVIPLWFVAMFTHLPVFWETHLPLWNRGVASLIQRVRGIVCISKGLADFYAERGVSKTRLAVAPSGVSEKFLEEIPHVSENIRHTLGIADTTAVIEYVGTYTTMEAGKGVDGILRAMALLRQKVPEAIVLLVGVGEKSVEKIWNHARSIALPFEALRIVPWVPFAEIPRYLRAANLLVMFFPRAEHYEKYMSPMKAFEYMTSGVPIVTSDLPSLREVLDEKSAFFVPPEDTEALAEKMIEVLHHTALARQKAEQAKKDVMQYTWSRRAQIIRAFIEKYL